MQWFGPNPFASVCADVPRAKTPPAGITCAHCDEGFTDEDYGFVVPSFDTVGNTLVQSEIHFHQECFVRLTVGSVAHQLKLCTCHGGELPDDDGTLTRRQAAIAAVTMSNDLQFHQPEGE